MPVRKRLFDTNAKPRNSSCCNSYVGPLIISLFLVASLSIIFVAEFHRSSFDSSNSFAKKVISNVIRPIIFEKKTALLERVPIIDDRSEEPVKVLKLRSISTIVERQKLPLEPYDKKQGAYDMHFIHIPKCGGTSMTTILRDVACTINPTRNKDCCTNPGTFLMYSEVMFLGVLCLMDEILYYANHSLCRFSPPRLLLVINVMICAVFRCCCVVRLLQLFSPTASLLYFAYNCNLNYRSLSKISLDNVQQYLYQ